MSFGDGTPRLTTVVVGSGGVGRTALLAAIASTRPAFTVPQVRARNFASDGPMVCTDWALSQDDPTRPHPLRITSPNIGAESGGEQAELRRREQASFARRATEGGYVLVSFSGARWFSRAPSSLATPERTILRYDPRAASVFDDAARAELARETKQVLVYAGVSAALVREHSRGAAELVDFPDPPELPEPVTVEDLELHPGDFDATAFERSMRDIVRPLLDLYGLSFVGIDPFALEPSFANRHGEKLSFDELPTAARHLLAFGVLTARALAGAYPGQDPRQAEGVALVDDIDLHQDPRVLRHIVPTLRATLPRVQWIVTTASQEVASGCEAGEVVALRRMPESARVEVYEGDLAVVH